MGTHVRTLRVSSLEQDMAWQRLLFDKGLYHFAPQAFGKHWNAFFSHVRRIGEFVIRGPRSRIDDRHRMIVLKSSQVVADDAVRLGRIPAARPARLRQEDQ